MKTDYMETNNAAARPDSLGRLLNFATGAMNRMCQARLAEHDLLLAQWVILSALWARDGLHVSELARYSGNNLPAASRIVDRMVDKGLVARSADAEDRRSVRVHLTEAGRAHEGLRDFHLEVNETLTAGMSDAETRMLFDLLGRVLENARRADGGRD
jgi:DNA-binding MarR family transcriptional regulator